MVLEEGLIGVARRGIFKRYPTNKGNKRFAGCRLYCVLFVFAINTRNRAAEPSAEWAANPSARKMQDCLNFGVR